jgi:hypothetical protein
MHPRSTSFNDVYHQIFSVTADLLAGKLDAQKAMAFAANMKVVNDLMNTEIKMRQFELSSNETLTLGNRAIFDTRENVEVAYAPEIIDGRSIKSLSNTEIAPALAAKTRKPKLGFIGLTPLQAGEISSTFGSDAELFFWMDEGLPKLKVFVNCDVIFSTGLISHVTTEYLSARGFDLKRKFVKITGSVSAIKYAVKSRFENWGAQP